MYISQLKLDLSSNIARRDFAKIYEMHRSILRAFPEEGEGGPGRVLYRIDLLRREGIALVLVQSDKKPDWNLLNPAVDYFASVPEVKEFNPNFKNGQTFTFCLRANPTYRKKEPEGQKGRRLGLYSESDLATWFLRKANHAGFMVTDLEESIAEARPCKNLVIIKEGRMEVHRPVGGRVQTHDAVKFEGKITVIDSELFLKALESGLGSGKGFGFGLLSLAPLRVSE